MISLCGMYLRSVNVFKKRECIEHVLRIIMEMKNLQVLDYTVQKDYKNLQGRSAILDCVARDDVNNQYNVEIQQDTEGASPKRARYHSGLLDMNTLNPGQDFEELTDSYVIFITKDDVPGNGLPIYHADRVIEETGGMFGDGSAYYIREFFDSGRRHSPRAIDA